MHIKDIEPKKVFDFFQEISNIPRGSGNEKAISDYLVAFAKERGLEVIQDEALNIIIRKPGTKGYEEAPGVILQGHMDMVCEKNNDTIHDFEKDPIKLKIEGDYIYAEGTTLGADNGIAVAYSLAILDAEDIPHPPLEVLITTEEETGLIGAMAVKPEHIKGRILINLDSEEEGKFLVSCAGGVRNKVILPISYEAPFDNGCCYTLKIRGLKGGHSGLDIIRQRANSNKLAGRVLADIIESCSIRLISLQGGSKTNAIPREMDVVFYGSMEEENQLKDIVARWQDIIANEYRAVDENAVVLLEKMDVKAEQVFDRETTEKAVQLLYLIPSGIRTMSQDIPGLVQSSTNLGVVITSKEQVEFHSAIRSSVGSLKEEIVKETKYIAKALGVEAVFQAGYPEWQYNSESKIRNISCEVYERLTGEKPEIVAIHAGVECGLFSEKFDNMDMISFGPNLYDVHTPEEHMSITSVQNLWVFLKELLKAIQ
ncbi:aminoacyl-histidine dipeptidase [Alloiococcus sp. CFN-8]|uniref:aminoacyl-histidine dipeptidase n=1 Tax=Alloiococcus sp. CFN-8 TaxID=3416081 RepID=UPI003CEB03D3